MAEEPVAYVPNPPGLFELLESPVGAVGRDMHRRGEKLLAESVRRCPVGRTRKLRDGLRVREDGLRFVLTSDQDYSEFVVKGTPAHTIEPRDASVLAFATGGYGGQTVFATRVDHPGTKPDNFALDALDVALRS